MGVLYSYKGNKYIILGETMMKDPSTREWVEAFTYFATGHSGKTYTREKRDFLEKFTKL